MQDGRLGILIQVYDGDGASPTLLEDVATSMVDAEPGTGPVAVKGLFATGGTFDIMPGQEQGGLLRRPVAIWDYDLPLNGGTKPINPVHTDPPRRRVEP